jgi:hypothetical protein
MGTVVRSAKTSPGPWDAFGDVDVFVDEVLAELTEMARDGTRRSARGPSRHWLERRCARRWRRSGASASVACSGGPSDSSATSPSTRSIGCSPVGPGLVSGVGRSIGCAAPGGAPAVISQNQAPWSSTVAPVARRRVVLSAVSMVARRSAASRSRWPLRNTASLWPSVSRRRTGTTPKPSFRFCVSSPMAASRVQPSAISATGANGWRRPVKRSASPSRPLRAAATDSSFPPASAGRSSPRFRGRQPVEWLWRGLNGPLPG